MAFTPARNRDAIVKHGGGIILVSLVSDTGAEISLNPDNVKDLGYIQESTFIDNTDTEDAKDETGNLIQSHETDRSIKITGVLMQTDKKTLDIAKECRGQFYQIYYYMGIVDGKYQELFAPICRIKPSVEMPSTTRRIPLEITILKNDTLTFLTITDNVLGTRYSSHYAGTDITSFGGGTGDLGVGFSIGDYYKIIETAV